MKFFNSIIKSFYRNSFYILSYLKVASFSYPLHRANTHDKQNDHKSDSRRKGCTCYQTKVSWFTSQEPIHRREILLCETAIRFWHVVCLYKFIWMVSDVGDYRKIWYQCSGQYSFRVLTISSMIQICTDKYLTYNSFQGAWLCEEGYKLI